MKHCMVKERELRLLPQSARQHRYNSYGCRRYRQLQESTWVSTVISAIGKMKLEGKRETRQKSYIFI